MENTTLPMISVDQALSQIDSLIPQPLEAESVQLEGALHRVLREPAIACQDHPATHRSSIDGYLVRADQPVGKVRLHTNHSLGQPAPSLPPLGSAVRILTGSPLPEDAALIMQEDTQTRESGWIEICKKPDQGLVRPKGSHCKKGDVLIPSLTLLDPGSVTLLAALGITQPKVSRLPRVVHFATGAELIEPSQTPTLGQIRDSNSILILSLLKSCMSNLIFQRRIGDHREHLLQSIQESLAHSPEMILVSGASSVGDHDHASSVFTELGFRVLFRSVSIRPGKPLILAQKDRTLAFALPGNPLSHFVCFHLFVRRAILRLQGISPPPFLSAKVVPGAKIKQDSRETWWPCRLDSDQTTLTAQPLPWQDSSDLSCLAQANGLLRIPAGQEARSPSQVLPTI